jgi:murein DD-endopeptidase MepM/ murein hydrolase activator NlpD
VLGRLLAGLVVIGGMVALVGVVAVQNGWLVVNRGSTVPATLASATDATTPTVVGAPPNADSANADTAGAGPLAAPGAAGVGDSVALPTLDPAYGDARRTGADSAGSSAGATDSLSGLGERAGGARTAPTVTATPAELTALRSRLKVPVRGVAASALRDDYEQARGGGTRQHQSLDILAPRGTPVTAAADGRIVKLFDSQQGGLTIYQSDPSDRFVLLYGHLDRYEAGLTEGASVRQGQVIGYVGSTGNADPKAPHLHFGVTRSADPARWWSSGTPVNPFLLLKP